VLRTEAPMERLTARSADVDAWPVAPTTTIRSVIGSLKVPLSAHDAERDLRFRSE
jgi:hypothetical protein